MKYYIQIKDGHGQGPFSIDELKELKINRNTLVWYNGLYGWTKAGELLELLDIAQDSVTPSPHKLLVNLFSEIEALPASETAAHLALPKRQLKAKILFALLSITILLAAFIMMDSLFLP